MNKVVLFSGCAAAILLAGCGPELARGAYGAEEEQWQKVISASYSGYRPPRTAPPAIVDKATPEALEKQRERQELKNDGGKGTKEEQPSVSENDPVKAVDEAAVKADEKPVKEEKKADEKPVKEEKKAAPADKKEEKAAKAEKAEGVSGDFIEYVVKAGDTPGSIAQKFYGKASFYEIILKANPQIKDPKQIRIGTKIKVPKLQ